MTRSTPGDAALAAYADGLARLGFSDDHRIQLLEQAMGSDAASLAEHAAEIHESLDSLTEFLDQIEGDLARSSQAGQLPEARADVAEPGFSGSPAGGGATAVNARLAALGLTETATMLEQAMRLLGIGPGEQPPLRVKVPGKRLHKNPARRGVAFTPLAEDIGQGAAPPKARKTLKVSKVGKVGRLVRASNTSETRKAGETLKASDIIPPNQHKAHQGD